MPSTVTDAGLRHKGRTSAFSVPPGNDLRELLLLGATASRPVFWLTEELAVPRLSFVPTRRRSGGYSFTSPREEASNEDGRAQAGLRTPCSLALDSISADASRNLREHNGAVRQFAYLYAAALRDIAGIPSDAIATELDYSETATARRAARKGRQLWVRLAAWPWWSIGSEGCKGGLPEDWWQFEDCQLTLAGWVEAGWEDPVRFGTHLVPVACATARSVAL